MDAIDSGEVTVVKNIVLIAAVIQK